YRKGFPLLLQIQPDRQGVRHPYGPAILNARRPLAAALQYTDGGLTCTIFQILDYLHIRKASIPFYHKRNLQHAVYPRVYRLLWIIIVLTNILHKCLHAPRWLRIYLDRLEQSVPTLFCHLRFILGRPNLHHPRLSGLLLLVRCFAALTFALGSPQRRGRWGPGTV